MGIGRGIRSAVLYRAVHGSTGRSKAVQDEARQYRKVVVRMMEGSTEQGDGQRYSSRAVLDIVGCARVSQKHADWLRLQNTESTDTVETTSEVQRPKCGAGRVQRSLNPKP